MKHNATVRNLRLLMLAGALVLIVGAGAKLAPGSHKAGAPNVTISSGVLKGAVLIADGSESTGGKPTKPHS